MTRKYLVIIVAIILMVISLGCISEEKGTKQTPITTPIVTPAGTGISSEKNIQSLPQSLDKYYEKEPVYLYNMWDLGGTIMGIITDLQQKDTNNTKNSFIAFSKLYKESAGSVPE